MSNYIFKHNIEQSYGSYVLNLYKKVKGLSANEYNYICLFHHTQTLDFSSNYNVLTIRKFLKDHQIEFLGLEHNIMWACIKNKEDLKVISLLLPLMCKFKFQCILKVSLLEKYEIACKKYQTKTYNHFKKYKLDKGIIEHAESVKK